MLKQTRPKKWISLALAVGLAVPAGTLVQSGAAKAEEPGLSKNEISLIQLFEILRDIHWGNIGEDALMRGAVKGMLDELKDPYTAYFTQEEYQDFLDSINQRYAGIGVALGQDSSGLFVKEVYSSTPAETAGLKEGDRIVSIDGLETEGRQFEQIAERIRGREGTSVTLRIQRAGRSPFDVTVVRKAIELPSLTSKLLDAETGYIRILSFTERVDQDFALALADLQRKGIKTLVLDLRGNGGGYLAGSLRIADKFLHEGVIVTIKQRGVEQTILADLEGVDLPLAVLIDRDSASAAELLAGALQANKRAKLVGERSFGKGVMQHSGIVLENGAIIKVTDGQFYFSDGSSPQGNGLTPDVPVSKRDLQLPVAVGTVHPERKKSVQFDLVNGRTYVNRIEIPKQTVLTKGGKRYIPLRFTLEVLGSAIQWNPEDESITFRYKGRDVKLLTGSGTMTVNGQAVAIEEPFVLEDGVTYLSTAAVEDALAPDRFADGANSVELEDF